MSEFGYFSLGILTFAILLFVYVCVVLTNWHLGSIENPRQPGWIPRIVTREPNHE